MKNLKFSALLGLIAIFTMGTLITLSSCKKEDPSGEESTKADITDGSWILTYSVGTTSYGTYDEYANMPEREKDDRVSFHKDGTWTVNDNGTICPPSYHTMSSSGTYTLNNGTELIIIDQTDTMLFNISTLTADLLVLKFKDFDSVMMSDISGVMKYKH